MNEPLSKSADVVIIGGGIAGLTTAYFLARRKVRVVLLEKGQLAWEQSSRNWGFVRQQGRDPVELPMVVLSNRIWSGFSEELDADMEWRQGGNLALAQNEEDMARYEEGAREAGAVGIDTRVITRQEVQAMLPGYQGPYVGGMYTASDGQADPLKATLAIARGARREGVEIHEYCAVEEFNVRDGRMAGVRTTKGEVAAEKVVCAAGTHSAFLGRMVGLDLPQRAVRSSVCMTAPLPHLTDLGVWGGNVGFRQARDGRVVLGRTSAGVADYDVTLDSLRHIRLFLPIFLKNRDLFRMRFGMPLVRDILRHLPGTGARRHPFEHLVDVEPPVNENTLRDALDVFRGYYPQLEKVSEERSWAGLIDATPDMVPVIGEVVALPGFFFVTGFSGHGFGLGPGAGSIAAELIDTGRSPLDIHSMRYERFAEGDMSKARKIL